MSTTHLERMQQEMAAITKPLVDHYSELEDTIKKMEVELLQLRKARTQLRATLRSINPELVPTNGKRKNGVPPHYKQGNSPEQLTALTKWLQEHRETINAENGVHASGLISGDGHVREDFPSDAIGIRSQSKVSAAMKILHEQGILRLDHSGNGGAKYYKVV